MSTKKLFIATTLFISAMISSFCFNSCHSSDDDNSLNTIPAVNNTNRNAYCELNVSDDFKDLYDVKITFKYAYQTVEKTLDECDFEKEDSTVISIFDSHTTYYFKHYSIKNPLNKELKSVIISSSVKPDAKTAVQNASADKKFDLVFNGRCTANTSNFNMNKSNLNLLGGKESTLFFVTNKTNIVADNCKLD